MAQFIATVVVVAFLLVVVWLAYHFIASVLSVLVSLAAFVLAVVFALFLLGKIAGRKDT